MQPDSGEASTMLATAAALVNAGRAGEFNADECPISPTTEPSTTFSPKGPQVKAVPESGVPVHHTSSGASAVTTHTFTKKGGDPYWVLAVVLLAAALIVGLAASFPYVPNILRQQCKTRSCRELSAVLRESIDPSISPCDNFYQHVCNGWLANAHRGLSVFDEIAYNLRVRIGHDALDAAAKLAQVQRGDHTAPSEQAAGDKAALFYHSCVLAPAHANRELGYLHDLRREMGLSWPFLYPVRRQRRHTEDATFDGPRLVLEALVNASVRWGFPLWFDVAVNHSKPRTVVIETLPSLPHPIQNGALVRVRGLRAQFEKLVRAMYKLFTNSDVIYDTIEPFLRSYWYMQSLLGEASKARDTLQFGNLTAFAAKLTANITAQAWADILSAALEVPVTKDDTPVVVIGAPFMPTLNTMLLELNTDALLLHLGWAFQLSMGQVLSREVAGAIHGWANPEEDMADYCFQLTEHLLGFALTTPMLRENLDANKKRGAEAVYASSRSYLRRALEGSSWMDEATKQRSFERLGDLQLDWTVSELVPMGKLYSAVPAMEQDSFVTNWKRLAQSRRHVRSAILAANARYYAVGEDGSLNYDHRRLTVPVARLQPPLFDGLQEPSVAMALLGSWFARKVARYLFHGDWLASETAREMHDRLINCLEPNFESDSIPSDAVASVALLEPMRHAFLATNTSVPGVTSAEVRLPGLAMLQGEQIFYTALCFTLCGRQAATGPGRTVSGERLCNVPLMHSASFAAAFKCPQGSPMNSDLKCNFW